MKSILLLFAFLDFAFGTAPSIVRIVSGGTFTPNQIAAGGYATIFGSSLSDSTYVSAGGTQWPVTLGQTTVMVCSGVGPQGAPLTGCNPAQLLYVSPGQINVLMPAILETLPEYISGVGEYVSVLTGTGSSQVSSNTLLVTLLWDAPDVLAVGRECPIDGQAANGTLPAYGTNCALSPYTPPQPGIMPLRGTITDTNGRLVDSANPAAIGGYYTIWLTGIDFSGPSWALSKFGPGELYVSLVGFQPPLPNPGNVAGDETGVPTRVTFAGPSPQFPGLAQINFQILATISNGTAGLWPCGSYAWELSVGFPSLVTPGATQVQIPLRIGPTDVPCQ